MDFRVSEVCSWMGENICGCCQQEKDKSNIPEIVYELRINSKGRRWNLDLDDASC
jgi:hypothetical protein